MTKDQGPVTPYFYDLSPMMMTLMTLMTPFLFFIFTKTHAPPYPLYRNSLFLKLIVEVKT